MQKRKHQIGARVVIPSGYILIRKPDHPRANADGFVREHFVVAEENGRTLAPGEIIHHKNGDRADNRFENFAFMTQSEHVRLHNLERTGLPDPVNFKRCSICREVKSRRNFTRTHSACRPCDNVIRKAKRRNLRLSI